MLPSHYSMGVQHGLRLGRGYYCHKSLESACISNHDSLKVDHFESVSRDYTNHSAVMAITDISQGNVSLETQGKCEATQEMQSEEGFMVGTFVSLCEKCREVKDLQCARQILLSAQNAGLEEQPVISYNLMLMFLECGGLRDAHQLFTRLTHRTDQCWTTLIRGFNESGQSQVALNLYEKHQQESSYACKHGIVGALKACADLQELESGRVLHVQLVEGMLETDQLVVNILVDMYSKCNDLVDAQTVFKRSPNRDLVSWNVLIGGYAKHGHAHSVQQCFNQMMLDGVSPDHVTYLCILTSCSKDEISATIYGLHVAIVIRGLDCSSSVGNNLVHLYAQLGSFAEAQQVLNLQIPQEEIAWTSLLGGYTEHDKMENALSTFELMAGSRIAPSIATYIIILRACVGVPDGLARGRNVHAEVVKRGFETHILGRNSLIDLYCKCGSLLDARGVFQKLATPDVCSWTALLFGYVEHSLPEEALRFLHQMGAEGVAPNAVSYLCGIKACHIAENSSKGQALHVEIIKEGFEANLVLGNTLFDFYAHCGLLAEAKEVFDHLPIRNVISWNSLMSSYGEQGNVEMILYCLKQMEAEGIVSTATTFLCALKACRSPSTLPLAQKIHIFAIKKGFECSLSLKNSLVDVYLKCNMVLEANNVFNNSGNLDIISWNTLMGGYSDAGLFCEVFDCSKRMQREGAAPNAPTFLTIIKSCKFLGLIDRGRLVHAMLSKAGFEKEPHVVSALVDMYAMLGNPVEAGSVLEKQQVPFISAWTAMIVGYMEHGFGEKALEIYEVMRKQGIYPDDSLFVCALKVCGIAGAMVKGQELYGELTMSGILEESSRCRFEVSTKPTIMTGGVGSIVLSLQNVLIDMFCRCGNLMDAQKVFEGVPTSDFVTWNALISGYAMQGNCEFLIQILNRMKSKGVWPDAATYTSVLTVCSHVGSIEGSQISMDEMSNAHGVVPVQQHYNCIVDLLSRAGQLDVAWIVLEKIPFQPDVVAWNTVSGGCCKVAEIYLGRHAFECLIGLVENGNPGFLSLSKIWMNSQLREDVFEVEVVKSRIRKGIG